MIVCAPTAVAQVHARPAIADSSAVRIMARVGSQPGVVWLQDVLRRADAEHSEAKLDEIADSLVARAMDPASAQAGSEANEGAQLALGALGIAGGRVPYRGRPYPGAFDRLIIVHRRAPSVIVRRRVLGLLLLSPDHARAVQYLRDVAESDDETAYHAIFYLITDANGGSWTGIEPTASARKESVKALYALRARHRVKDPRAESILVNSRLPLP
jgi:hypothetical protein